MSAGALPPFSPNSSAYARTCPASVAVRQGGPRYSRARDALLQVDHGHGDGWRSQRARRRRGSWWPAMTRGWSRRLRIGADHPAAISRTCESSTSSPRPSPGIGQIFVSHCRSGRWTPLAQPEPLPERLVRRRGRDRGPRDDALGLGNEALAPRTQGRLTSSHWPILIEPALSARSIGQRRASIDTMHGTPAAGSPVRVLTL